ncbi:TetR/AcrR family transcriptional regulator [Actinomadura madurae]|uniref:TetR/AcrR family transcriptional regulator n=1 Tax=Actinomadura madurae TaxID=1993 RepID=UPI00355874EA
MATTRGSRRPTAEERRDQVLEAGISVFAEFGYHATKTADIARRAASPSPTSTPCSTTRRPCSSPACNARASRSGTRSRRPGRPATPRRRRSPCSAGPTAASSATPTRGASRCRDTPPPPIRRSASS